jgi:serine/threonine protein kinase
VISQASCFFQKIYSTLWWYFEVDLKLENVLFTHNTLRKETVDHAGRSYVVDVPVNTNIKRKTPSLRQCSNVFSCFQNCPGCSRSNSFVFSSLQCDLTHLCMCVATAAVIDFGGATYEHDRSKSRIINTRQYRSPEVGCRRIQ